MAELDITDSNIAIRHDWTPAQIKALFAQPFNDLLFQAQSIHRHYFDPNAVQISSLLSIKTGACPEDCSYCPQSVRYDTGLEPERLMPLEEVKQAAQNAKNNGASRFCMGAAWRTPTDRNLDRVIEMIGAVKELGLETCVTLGMLNAAQTKKLKSAGLDYYNHNIDTSPDYYQKVITTRTYQDRLDTLDNLRAENINVCCGGIVGMGESELDRAALLQQLANMPQHPQSVPINMLVQVQNTPLHGVDVLDPIEFVRTIAVARILMPKSTVRLSAGRNDMTEETQTLCFLAGANSIFYGETLLTTPNPAENADLALFAKLGIHTNDKHASETVTA